MNDQEIGTVKIQVRGLIVTVIDDAMIILII